MTKAPDVAAPVLARKGDVAAYQVMAGGYTPVSGPAVEAQPVWRVGLVTQASRGGIVRTLTDLRDAVTLKMRSGGGSVISVLVAPGEKVDLGVLAQKYGDRYTRENWATQGDFATDDEVREFVRSCAKPMSLS